MPYQLLYGNPFPAGGGAALFRGGKAETDFARNIENNRVKLQVRQLAQEQARIVLAAKAQQIQEAQFDRELAQRQQEFTQQLQLRRAEIARQAQQFAATHGLQAAQERRLAAGQTIDTELRRDELGLRSDDLTLRRDILGLNTTEAKRKELNLLRAQGFKLAKEREPAEGEVAYTDAAGRDWIGPSEGKRKLDWLRDQLAARQEVTKGQATNKAGLAYAKLKLATVGHDLDRRLKEGEELRDKLRSLEGALAGDISRLAKIKPTDKIYAQKKAEADQLQAEVARLKGEVTVIPTRQKLMQERDHWDAVYRGLSGMPIADPKVAAQVEALAKMQLTDDDREAFNFVLDHYDDAGQAGQNARDILGELTRLYGDTDR